MQLYSAMAPKGNTPSLRTNGNTPWQILFTAYVLIGTLGFLLHHVVNDSYASFLSIDKFH